MLPASDVFSVDIFIHQIGGRQRLQKVGLGNLILYWKQDVTDIEVSCSTLPVSSQVLYILGLGMSMAYLFPRT